MNTLRILGDIHGLQNRYYNIVKDCEYSVQLGDFGFNYDIFQKLDPEHHVFFAGNHSNYDKYYNCPNGLGDFGLVNLGPFEFFFVRGGYSIDKKWRVRQEKKMGIKSWWQEEELTEEENKEAIKLYKKIKPRFMLSHECPNDLSDEIGNPTILREFDLPSDFSSSTQRTLQKMWEIHQPEIWIFGHFHINLTLERKETLFIALGELSWVDLNENLDIIRRG